MASILGLAATAFVADRMFLQEGSARPPVLEEATPSDNDAKGSVAAEPLIDAGAQTLAERLQNATGALRDQRADGDPFNPKWREVLAAASRQNAKGGPAMKRAETAEAFASTHSFTSVTRSRKGMLAVIAKQPRQIGDDVDGWTLRSVASDGMSAVLELGSTSVVLKLRRPETAKPGASARVSHEISED